VILRCTTKFAEMLGCRSADLVSPDAGADDWYGDVFWVDRRKCLLLMHAGTMLALFVPDVRKADLTPVGPFLVHHIQEAAADEGLPPSTFGTLDPTDIGLARTASRSVLGCMRHDRELLKHVVAVSGGLANSHADELNRVLRRTVHLPRERGPVFPLDEARRRLHA
jgi:hypothetical protein